MRSPDQEPPNINQPRSRWRRWWKPVATTSALLAGGFALGGWIFVETYLTPLMQDAITQSLDRPVQLGKVEGISISRIRFGQTLIPATAKDKDQVKVAAIETNFNLLELFWSRSLSLNLRVIKPEIYLEQDEELNWVNLNIKEDQQESNIKIEVDSLRFEEADVILVARDINKKLSPPVPLKLSLVEAEFLDNNQRIKFDLQGQLAANSEFKVVGESLPNQGNTKLVVSGNQIGAKELGYLLPLPFQLLEGRVNGNLEITLRAKKSTIINGNTTLENVRVKVDQLPQVIDNVNGQLGFLGQAIQADNLRASLGGISTQVKGKVDLNSGFDLQIVTAPLNILQALTIFNIPKLPVDLQGQVRTNLAITGKLDQPVISGQVINVGTVLVDRLNLAKVQSNFRLVGNDLSLSDINLEPTFGGILTGNGQFQLSENQNFNLNLVANNFSLTEIGNIYKFDLPLENSLVSVNANFLGSLKDLSNFQGVATAQAASNNGINITTNLQINQGTWQALIKATNLELALANSDLLQELKPNINGEFNLVGTTNSLQLDNITGNGLLRIAVAGGLITARNLQLNQGSLQTQITAENLQLNNLSFIPVELQESSLNGEINAIVDLNNFQLNTINARGSGNLTLAGGIVTAGNILVRNGNWQTTLIARNIQIDRLSSLPSQFQGSNLNGEFNLAGSLDNFNLEAITARGFANLGVAGGIVNISNAELIAGNFRALIMPVGLELNRLANNLVGQLDGALTITGNINNLSPRGILATGEINLPQGVAVIDRPLNASINWNGQRLQINQATAQNLTAQGFADLDFNDPTIITQWDFNINAADLNLQSLPLTLPSPVTLAGRGDFQGRVRGNLVNPEIMGNLQLRNLVSTGIAFAPVLSGTINANQSGTNLLLTGEQDRIELALSPQFLPNSFFVQRGDILATGRVNQNNLLAVNFQNFPLQTLRPFVISTPLGGRAIAGNLSGDFNVDLNNFNVVGTALVNNPQINTLRGETFTANFIYEQGNFYLSRGNFRRGEAEYTIVARVNQLFNTPQIQADVKITNGDIQDVLTALQIFEIRDLTRGLTLPAYGNAADLGRLNAGRPEPTLAGQLRRLSELQELLAQQRETSRDQSFNLPELSTARGRFNGNIQANGSLAGGINAEFNLLGGDWRWGNYQLDQVQVQGNFRNNILTLLPLSLRDGDRVVRYQGTIGGAEQSGQLIVEKVPVAVLSQLLQLPSFFGVTGEISSTTTLSGSIDNPAIRGDINVSRATLNQVAVNQVETSFSYLNSRLRFGTNVSIAGQQESPLTINGSIPYQLPFATTIPSDNNLHLNLQVRDQELAILDILTQGQVIWGGGKGAVQVLITGVFDQQLGRPTNLIADGSAVFENATLKVQVLPIPLTGINGRIAFDFDRIRVEGLRGELGGGEVTIAGNLPISEPRIEAEPLVVRLDNLLLNLPDLYSGGVQGNIFVAGTALAPRLGGNVEVFDGQVLLTVPQQTVAANSSPEGSSNTALRTELSNLRLTLGRNMQLNLPPVLNFTAGGSLVVNGPFDNLRPEGIIELRRGRVNLFTSEFRLVGGYPHTAQFVRDRGLDPFLNLRLATSVEESTGRRLPTNETLPEIREQPLSAFGTVQTVRVEARVNGYASELSDRLELASSPRRTQPEIIALLGGNLIDSFSQGNANIGLANLVSSALLSNFQNQVSDALGLATFRIFPTTISDRGQISSTLGLGAEIGIDVTPSLSVSALRVLTANQPFQYSLRYRVNENILLRGSSNLSGDNRFLIEYENRF